MEAIKMYLDYSNNFDSLQLFAEKYNISTEQANETIIKGREQVINLRTREF
jgi:hypothetical protein